LRAFAFAAATVQALFDGPLFKNQVCWHADLRVSNVMELKGAKQLAAEGPELDEHDLAGRAAALSFNGENVSEAARLR
jgi:hypothetical protein